jgi:hypothetical protein
MSDHDGLVGGLHIPVQAEGYPSNIGDPVVLGLAGYFAYWIRWGLTYGMSNPNTQVPDPLPATHVFPFNPGEMWTRNQNDDGVIAIPALYLWWEGESTVVRRSSVNFARQRTLRLFYAAKEVTYPDGGSVYAGMPNAVDAILHKASVHGYHTDYAPSGFAPGTPIIVALDLLGWSYEGGKQDVAARTPDISPKAGGKGGGAVIRGWPVLFGNVLVLEAIQPPTAGASNGPQDIEFNANVNDPADVNGPLEIMTRYLPAKSENESNG